MLEPHASQSSHADRQRSFRSRHRSRSHEEAHGEDDVSGDLLTPVPADMAASHHAAVLVETDAQLAEAMGHIAAAGSFAFDTEFIGELSYHPLLCLIQVATDMDVWLIDPMAELDLSPLWAAVCDPGLRTLVHAGEQDLEIVARQSGRAPRNVFDTQLAAGFCGLAYPASLSKLLLELFDVKLAKGFTFSQWDKRPLSRKQLLYAADDVRFLPAMAGRLGEMLAAHGNAWLAQAACQERCLLAAETFRPELAYQRVKGSGSIEGRPLAVLAALAVWRDAAARAADLPPRAYLKDELLTAIAKLAPVKPDHLERVRGLPRPVREQEGERIVQAVLAGKSAAVPASVSRAPEASPRVRFLADSAWALAQVLAAARGIDAAAVTSRQDVGELLATLIDQGPEAEPLQASPLLTGWRRDALGEALLNALTKAEPLHLKWDGRLRVVGQ